MPEFTPAPGGPQFRAPGFLQPRTFGGNGGIPQSFDEMFDRVAKAKALEDQKKTQKKNKENAMNMFMLKNPDIPPELLQASQEPGFAQTMQTGRDRSDFLQDPMTGGTVPPQMSDVENQATDFFQQRREQQAEQQAQAEFKRTPKTQEAVIAQRMASGELNIDEGIAELQKVRSSKRAPKQTFKLGDGERFVSGKGPGEVPAGTEEVELIPGSKAFRENVKAEREDKERVRKDKLAQLNLLHKKRNQIKQMDKIKSQASFYTVGILGAASASLNQPSKDLKANLGELFANLAFDRLTQMRSESKTGGALGQVSERELALLGASQGNIEQSQSKEQFIENMDRIQDSFRRFAAILDDSAKTKKERFIMLKQAGLEDKDAIDVIGLEEY